MEEHYLGSANSYNGFYSLFEEIFDRKKFERVFILKGGPGTGKSTFMKRMAESARKRGADIDYYHCSSDVSSLDGVIISISEKKFAIIDGTAPHETDAIYVGAADEIVNLGEGIDSDWISAYREKIIGLSEQKSAAYKNAYSYLKIAGECDKYICKEKMSCFDYKTADKYIADLQNLITCEEDCNESRKFVSSFSKSGYKSFCLESEKKIKISGDRREAALLITYINEKLYGCDKEVFPAPLNKKYVEALRFGNKIVIQYDSDEENASADLYFAQSQMASENVRVMLSLHKDSLDEAVRWFGIASDLHFRLEEIYQKCMNFDINEENIIKVSKKILKLCDCES